MKKFIYKAVLMGVLCLAFGQLTMAQPAVPPPPASACPRAVMTMKMEIRQKLLSDKKGIKTRSLHWKLKTVIFSSTENLWRNSTIRILSLRKENWMKIQIMANLAYSRSPFREPRIINDEMMERNLENMDRQRNSAEINSRSG